MTCFLTDIINIFGYSPPAGGMCVAGTAQHSTAQHSTAQHSTAQHSRYVGAREGEREGEGRDHIS